jgi:hypothetical protein
MRQQITDIAVQYVQIRRFGTVLGSQLLRPYWQYFYVFIVSEYVLFRHWPTYFLAIVEKSNRLLYPALLVNLTTLGVSQKTSNVNVSR